MKRRYKEILPSYNDRIHEENPYKDNPPDFAKLAEEFPEIRKYLSEKEGGGMSMHWSNPHATKLVPTNYAHP